MERYYGATPLASNSEWRFGEVISLSGAMGVSEGKEFRGRSFAAKLVWERRVWTWLCDLLDVSRPSLMILGNDDGLWQNMLVQACRQKGVPTLLVQDGILLAREASPFALWSAGGLLTAGEARSLLRRVARAPYLWCLHRLGVLSGNGRYGAAGCDRIAVMGTVYRDLLVSEGIPASRIVVTGQPRFHQGVRKGPPVGQRGCRVLVADYLYGNWADRWRREDRAILEQVVRFARGNPRGGIVVRPHPGEPAEWYWEHLSGILHPGDETAVEVTRVESLEKQLLWADVVLTRGSTVILEASLSGCSVVFVDTHRRSTGRTSSIADLRDIEGLVRVDAVEDVSAALLGAWRLGQPSAHHHVDAYVAACGGVASRAVADVIGSMLVASAEATTV